MKDEPHHPQFQISVTDIGAHLLDVHLLIPSPSQTGHMLSLPAWIPGSYMVRDFAKNIVAFSVTDSDGEAHGYSKLDKQTWLLAPNERPLHVHYQIYAFDLSVRGAYVSDQYAFFNGTSVFLQVDALKDCPQQVSFNYDLPDCSTWQTATSLPLSDEGVYRAENYMDLIDHPILLGQFDRVDFQVEETEFSMVFAGGHFADLQRIGDDVSRLCQHHFDLFGTDIHLPNYLFISLMTENGFGGLEHRSSTALMYSRDELITPTGEQEIPDGYRDFLALASHEFLHTWHVKRTRPKVFLSPDLSKEIYTPQLWIYEGFTSYYDDFSLYRCGLISQENYLEVLGKQLTRLSRNQGRFKQSITESSYYAWTRFYQQDESAINNIVSYYNKGAILALCLDLSLRQQTNKNLDEVMQTLWQRFGKGESGTDDCVIHDLLTELGAEALLPLLDQWLYTTDELPYEALLNHFGVTVQRRPQAGPKDTGGKPSDVPVKHVLGVKFKPQGSGLLLQQVTDNSPAHIAGLQKGDVLLAIDGWQVSGTRLQSMLDRLETNKSVEAVILRDARLITLGLTPTRAPDNTLYLQVNDQSLADKWLQQTSSR